MSSTGIELYTFQRVEECFNQLRNRVPLWQRNIEKKVIYYINIWYISVLILTFPINPGREICLKFLVPPPPMSMVMIHTVFWITRTWNPERRYRSFIEIYCFHIQGRQGVDALHSCEMLVHMYQTTRCRSPEDQNMHTLRSTDCLVLPYKTKLHAIQET
jgi:hypothetical protein